MVKTRSMTARDAAPWSDLHHDVLLLVMMQLGVIDFLSFSGVCKSWRSFALNNRTKFMSSRLPMYLSFSDQTDQKTCFLQDYEGRKFKTILPHSAGRTCIGVTCGYVILFRAKTSDFWLVNPITRHQLHFPNVSFSVYASVARAILVYSPALSAPVFVITNRFCRGLWFSIAGNGAWSKVSSVNCFLDLHVFKGKIYALTTSVFHIMELDNICELTLVPEPKLTRLEIKKFPIKGDQWEFVSSDENLYVVRFTPEEECKIHEVDIGEMKWVFLEKTTTSENAFFLGSFMTSAAVNPLSWAGWLSRSAKCPQSGQVYLDMENMHYFPHECFNVNRLNDL